MTKRYWMGLTASWFLYGAMYAGIALTFSRRLDLAAMYGWGALGCLLASHALRLEILRRGWRDLAAHRLIPRVVAALIGASLAVSLWVGLFMLWPLQLMKAAQWDWRAYFFGAVAYLVPLSLWQAALLGIDYFDRWKQGELDRVRLEMTAKDAQLRALAAQLNPHFLFNSLNSLRALISEDPARAQVMVTELASILRYSLQAGRTDKVTLAEELEAVTNYLRLESIRLEERLRVKIDVPRSLYDAILPPMVLQTLVENGVKHGVSPRPGGGDLVVEARREGEALRVEVRNSGQLAAATAGTRIGLENARSRLRMLCGPDSNLDLRNSGHDSVVAELRIPYARAAN